MATVLAWGGDPHPLWAETSRVSSPSVLRGGVRGGLAFVGVYDTSALSMGYPNYHHEKVTVPHVSERNQGSENRSGRL